MHCLLITCRVGIGEVVDGSFAIWAHIQKCGLWCLPSWYCTVGGTNSSESSLIVSLDARSIVSSLMHMALIGDCVFAGENI